MAQNAKLPVQEKKVVFRAVPVKSAEVKQTSVKPHRTPVQPVKIQSIPVIRQKKIKLHKKDNVVPVRSRKEEH